MAIFGKYHVADYLLIMQNEPNFQKREIGINYYTERRYGNLGQNCQNKNEPKTNPIIGFEKIRENP